MQHTILVVDDEKDIVESLERQFRKNCRILKAYSGMEALKILQTEKVQLIISDQRMPEMTGVQLFSRVQILQPDAIRILLTGYTDVASIIAAINTGQIYRYVTKPWDPTDLEIVINKALETYDLRSELKEKNAKLQSALDELKVLDHAKNHFMILIGHELKTPLTAISSFTALLKEENLGEPATKYISRIEQGGQRLQEIVVDVLDILSAEVGQMPVNKGVHRVSQATAQAALVFNDSVLKKNLTIKQKDTKAVAFYDPTLIQKVLKKIIHNAIKFANEGSSVEIDATTSGEFVDISVKNSGPMITADKIQAVLKPFTLDEDIMHHTNGLGLGLSVCQSLLKRHGSQLTITSNRSETTVGFRLKDRS